jgi:hypothetical protein
MITTDMVNKNFITEIENRHMIRVFSFFYNVRFFENYTYFNRFISLSACFLH